MARSRGLTRALERRAAATQRAADERVREAGPEEEEGGRPEGGGGAGTVWRGIAANQEEALCSSASFPLSAGDQIGSTGTVQHRNDRKAFSSTETDGWTRNAKKREI